MSKLALITGSTKGLGLEITKLMLSKGYDVLLSSRNQAQLESLKKELEVKHPQQTVHVHAVNFSDATQTIYYLEQISKLSAKIDVVFNNVGLYLEDDLSEAKDVFDQVMQVNLKCHYLITKRLLPEFLKQNKGYFFTICSALSKQVRIQAASYSIAKHGLYALHKLLVQQTKDTKVKATAFLPGSMNTASWENIQAPRLEFIQPKDVILAIEACLSSSEYAQTDEIILNSKNSQY